MFHCIGTELEEVRTRIQDLLQTTEAPIRDPLAHLMNRSGKMIRPALVLLAGKACNRFQKEHIELAAIVELIHTATLLHDDVIDQASVRRNRPCTNTLWGNTAAVLLGDFLLSRAFALGLRLNQPKIYGSLIKTAEEICQGELLQNLQRGNWELTEEEYLQIIDGKTATLFACSAALGARAAKAGEQTIGLLDRYGRLLGRAFQIRDDILDLLGSEASCGKTVGTDLAECKLTLPLIVWLRTLPADQRAKEIRHLSESTERPRILRDIQISGAVEYAQQTKLKNCEQACETLEDLSNSTARETLIQLAQAIAGQV